VSTSTGCLRLLFFLRAVNFDRVFECFLRELLGRGHRVAVVFDRKKGGLPADATRLFDTLRAEFPGLSYEDLPPRKDWWLRGATALRYAIDYLRYLEPEYADAHTLRARARSHVPVPLRVLIDPPVGRGSPPRPVSVRILRALESALPVSHELRAFIHAHQPDVVLVSPLVGLGSPQGDYVRAAEADRIPTVLPVASWDNLTNKGVIRETPTRTIVWNDRQVDEAVRLHRLPRDKVVAVGAHTWDHWFEWSPSTTREAFAEKVGLAPGRPFLLYVCSSGFIAGDEAEFIRDWLGELRSSTDARLRELGVVIRPHPQNVKFWSDFDLAEPGLTVVYPTGGAAPTDAQRKADYFDSLFHSTAVIGVNTSALAEAAIVRRPVLTLLSDRFRGTQEGTLHFAHIAGPDGHLIVASDWAEHHAQLAEVLEHPSAYADRVERFLASFVRPAGLDRPAAALAADEVEAVLSERSEPATSTVVARSAALGAVVLLQIGGPRWLWPGGRMRWLPRAWAQLSRSG
jgi:hypothetical protein